MPKCRVAQPRAAWPNNELQAHLAQGEGEEGSWPTCRICFEESVEVAEFITPCKCTGTQKYVHMKCLRRWQDSVMTIHDRHDVRAYCCSVCCTKFAYPPLKQDAGWRAACLLRGLGTAACLSLMAFGFSGPPWPHLVLLLLLLLGTRSNGLLALALLLLGCLMLLLLARGLRLVMRVDGQGRLGVALIRHGAPVEGLHAGALLVASEQLDRGIFRRSVVLLTEHSGAATKGVILTQLLPYADGAAAQAGLEAAARGGTGRGAERIQHHLGGPVGMPGPGPASQLALLHTVGDVEGAQQLPVTSTQASSGLQLYYGGSLTQAAEKVLASGQAEHQLWLFHGVCAWAAGQLEGEIRSGAWGWGGARVEDLAGVPPEQLWRHLVHDAQRVQWLP